MAGALAPTHGIQSTWPGLSPEQFADRLLIRPLRYAWQWLESRAHVAPQESIATWRYPAGWCRRERSRMDGTRGVGFFLTWPLRLNCPAERPASC